jgi:hypothetical protein
MIRCPVPSGTHGRPGAGSAHPPRGCCCGPLRLRSPGESPRFPRHTTCNPRTLYRRSAWPELDHGGSLGQEAQQEAQAAEKEAQEAWRAAKRPSGGRTTVSSGGCDLYSRALLTVLRWAAMRSDGRERHRRDFLLRAGGVFLRLRRILLLRHLRLPRRRRHVRSVPGTILQRHTAMLRRPDLHQRVLWWLPGPRRLLYRGFAMLPQQLRQWRLLVGAGRTLRARRRLPQLLPRPELQRRLCERQLRGLSSTLQIGPMARLLGLPRR